VVDPITVHPETDAALRRVPIHVQADPGTGTVTVSFDLPHSPVPQQFGITIQAGWSDAPLAVHPSTTS